MNPITPTRFIELLLEDIDVKLWDTKSNQYIRFDGISKRNWGEYRIHLKGSDNLFQDIKHLYESKPETPYTELCSIHNDLIDSCGGGRQEIRDLYIFLNKHEFQLKEMK